MRPRNTGVPLVERGAFIVVEGIDGSGKTTQCSLLAEYLRTIHGLTVESLRDPGASPLGEHLRTILKDPNVAMSPVTQALLFSASRQSLSELILEKLKAKTTVIVDRWVLTTMAQQGIEGVHPTWSAGLYLGPAGYLRPDMTVLLKVDPDVARSRLTDNRPPDRFDQRDAGWFERLSRSYLGPASTIYGRATGSPVQIIDASGGLEAVHDGLITRLLRYPWADELRRRDGRDMLQPAAPAPCAGGG